MRCPGREVHAAVAACYQGEDPESVDGWEVFGAWDAVAVFFLDLAFDLVIFSCVDSVALSVAHSFVCCEAPLEMRT